jgi:two-component system response regulator WspF
MRIAIVNDMFMAVEAIRRILASAGGHQIVWIARDGAEAVELCARDRPDLILMDLIMPRMDGVEATRRIMAATPCPIVVVTASVNDHAAQVFEAMGCGALDAVNTPVLTDPGDLKGAHALLKKVETIRKLIGHGNPPLLKPGHVSEHRGAAKGPGLVAIGASAGGPVALVKLLAALPGDFPAAMVVVQHVDEQFAEGLAAWLRDHTALGVRLAEEGDRPAAGTVYLAAKEDHLVLAPSPGALAEKAGQGASRQDSATHLAYTRQPVDCSYRPSVDVFFKSVVAHWRGTAIGLLLTGMGRDGAEGLKALRACGHHTIAQDQASSAVYGMPKAAAELDAATEILPLDKIARALLRALAGSV